MGTPKKNAKKIQSQLRPRTTRSSKARLLSDPMENTALLTEQLRSLGLYAAPTLGDGNCLFRALSDQLYGTPSRHAQLRKDICDWIARHKSRYEPFVEDERGLDVHLKCMRENATYGGHMELSAFAHLTRHNVKVIQPGLVYVIEWAAGGPSSPVLPSHPIPASSSASLGPSSAHSASSSSLSSLSSLGSQPGPSHPRGRRPARDKDSMEGVEVIDVDADGAGDAPSQTEVETVYVAYHDWEHFSSIRNLKGPHSGLPFVCETPAPAYGSYPPSPTSGSPGPKQSKADAKERKRLEKEAKERAKRERREGKNDENARHHPVDEPAAKPQMPKVRLKLSSASPTKALSPTLPPLASRLRSADRAAAEGQGQGRVQRSPKRSFDESSGGGEGTGSESESVAKRTRSAYRYAGRGQEQEQVAGDEDEGDEGDEDDDEDAEGEDEEDDDVDVDMESDDGEGDDDATGAEERTTSGSSGTSGTSLSLSLSPPALSSSSSLSSLSSVSPSPPPPEVVSMTAKPLTRRQRKALGLPKTRAAAATTGKGGAGKIVIPGGRYEGTGEWRRNGTGRVDVRGFRELKI